MLLVLYSGALFILEFILFLLVNSVDCSGPFDYTLFPVLGIPAVVLGVRCLLIVVLLLVMGYYTFYSVSSLYYSFCYYRWPDSTLLVLILFYCWAVVILLIFCHLLCWLIPSIWFGALYGTFIPTTHYKLPLVNTGLLLFGDCLLALHDSRYWFDYGNYPHSIYWLSTIVLILYIVLLSHSLLLLLLLFTVDSTVVLLIVGILWWLFWGTLLTFIVLVTGTILHFLFGRWYSVLSVIHYSSFYLFWNSLRW